MTGHSSFSPLFQLMVLFPSALLAYLWISHPLLVKTTNIFLSKCLNTKADITEPVFPKLYQYMFLKEEPLGYKIQYLS